MSKPELETSLTRVNRLEEAYFSEPSRYLQLAQGEVLMRSGDHNRRLYLIKGGRFAGRMPNAGSAMNEPVIFERGQFVGVQSFFSRSFISAFTIEAMVPSQVAYIDRDQQPVQMEGTNSLDEQFLPVVVDILMHRQLLLQHMAEKQENVMMRMREVEKLASLGQLSAGVAHELNNTLSVLAQGTRWISDYVSDDIRHRGGLAADFFHSGLTEGRSLASAEIRRRAKELKEDLRLSSTDARHLARTGLPMETLSKLSRREIKRAEQLHQSWEVGATLHDMLLGATQAEHVIGSMRELGAPTSERRPGVDVGETIRRALSLTHSRHKNMNVLLEVVPLPTITANSGELVQVWTNLIRNACDAIQSGKSTEPCLQIRTRCSDTVIQVQILDNGPGIDDDILPYIFQPNVTTKKKGLSFGLGLGLTIVHRLVSDYGGTITADSNPEGASFTITLPVEGRDHG